MVAGEPLAGNFRSEASGMVRLDPRAATGMYDFLRKVPLFAELSHDDFARICELAEEMRIAPKERLFAEGEPGDRAFVIRSGEVEISKGSAGRDVLLAVRTTGDVIGEMALIEDAPRMATATARRGGGTGIRRPPRGESTATSTAKPETGIPTTRD